MNVLSKIKKNSRNCLMKFAIFAAEINICILHEYVFVHGGYFLGDTSILIDLSLGVACCAVCDVLVIFS